MDGQRHLMQASCGVHAGRTPTPPDTSRGIGIFVRLECLGGAALRWWRWVSYLISEDPGGGVFPPGPGALERSLSRVESRLSTLVAPWVARFRSNSYIVHSHSMRGQLDDQTFS